MPPRSRSDRQVAYPIGTKVRVRRHSEYRGDTNDIFATPMSRYEDMITTIIDVRSDSIFTYTYHVACSGTEWWYTNAMLEVIGYSEKPCATSEAFTDMFN